jgi:hypothetical protein
MNEHEKNETIELPAGRVLVQKMRPPAGNNAFVGMTDIGHVHTLPVERAAELLHAESGGEFEPARASDAAAIEAYRTAKSN